MLLGRLPERAALSQLLDAARAGRSGVLVVRGEPGVGKTALLEYAMESAAGLRVARVAGVESRDGVGICCPSAVVRADAGSAGRAARASA